MTRWVTLDGEPVDAAALPELDVLADEAGLDIGLTPAIPVEQGEDGRPARHVPLIVTMFAAVRMIV